jgi:hypothetical protein
MYVYYRAGRDISTEEYKSTFVLSLITHKLLVNLPEQLVKALLNVMNEFEVIYS